LKIILRLICAVLVSMCLTSCLRDASTVPYESYIPETFTEMSENVTEIITDTEAPPPEVPKPHAEVMKWCSLYETSADVIMTEDLIKAENRKILNGSDAVTDIFSYPETVTADELRSLIAKYNLPGEVRYDSDGSVITEEYKNTVRLRMTVDDNGTTSVKLGIVVSRCDLRAVPDTKPYRKSVDNLYDSIQLTELAVGVPVQVLFTSFDGLYYYVVSYFYSGWVSCESVAIAADRAEWSYFAEPERFAVVTDALYAENDAKLDMGVTLPFVSNDNHYITVHVPVRLADSSLSLDELILPKTSASIGYLPYTYENYLTQAFKYEGTEYGWGGLDDGVDCSGFVSNVFKCFGFFLPRDTKDQHKIVGSAIDVSSKSHTEIASYLEHAIPTAVYYPGHTLLYIGHDAKDGKYYFIHAPQIGEKVTVTTKTDLTGMTYIGRLGL